MSQQTALLVTEAGKPIIKSTTWPIPTPGSKQLLIRVTVAALNPHDHKVRDWGRWFKDDLPTPIANDIVGVVDKIGSEVSKFKVGDRVYSYGNVFEKGHFQNGLVQYAIADEAYSAKAPENLTDHDVATLPVNVSASAIGLFDEGSGLGIPAPWTAEAKSFDYANTTLLIIGGGSNCGRLAVQLARLVGIGKIVVLGGKEEELKKWGATQVLDRHGEDEAVHSRIMSAVGDDLIYVFDAVNDSDTLYVGINALSSTRKGRVARLIPTSPHETAKVTKKADEYEVKDTFGIPHGQALGTEFWAHLGEYVEDGKIVPLKYEVADGVGLDAEKVNEVLDRYRDGKPVVQTHFRVSE
ncbi:putative alcohol dehydrogenase [Melanomma pulvis-pyrius CBS 109.77]|uniref:Putative alcohol dehydrogenase n=1 Tax=Melanomma pulvis-pyrius CBS 109.77 TaxID=1314802 RepID=A0A6A6X6H0_9PLEO|nr:putative alcohol dehydrogenase [Melanomma pulvis-pyrius CBS 109.77]